MLKLRFDLPDQRLRLLCIGAHSDDIEIGCGGTVLQWLSSDRPVEVTWVVLCGAERRNAEAKQSANVLLRAAKHVNVVLRDFRDGYFPAQFSEIKKFFEELKESQEYDLIFSHHLSDHHQDHRLVAELTWQMFRDHLILEYEIPKYEGDLGQPNVFVSLCETVAKRKVEHLMCHFGSQRSKGWFRAETFLSLMWLRGIECRAESGHAEAFHARKLCL